MKYLIFAALKHVSSRSGTNASRGGFWFSLVSFIVRKKSIKMGTGKRPAV